MSVGFSKVFIELLVSPLTDFGKEFCGKESHLKNGQARQIQWATKLKKDLISISVSHPPPSHRVPHLSVALCVQFVCVVCLLVQ